MDIFLTKTGIFQISNSYFNINNPQNKIRASATFAMSPVLPSAVIFVIPKTFSGCE